MSVIEKIKAKAKTDVKHIVLAEGSEPRTVQAAAKIVAEGLAKITLVGKPEEIAKVAAETGTDLKGVAIVDPATCEKSEAYAQKLCELRQKKGMTIEQARDLVYGNTLYFATMMLKMDDADGMVAGAINSTGNVLRPALQIIKTKPGIHIVSSSFLMNCPNPDLGQNGLLIYADCVVVPCPTAEELAQIAVSAAETARVLCGIEEPRVALLSFSTKGSAKHELVDKVRRAVEIAHEMAPELLLDGEMQLDAALVPEVGTLKAPGSPVAGRANVLVFPDLQAGNIGYKITQRIGGAECYAVLQGLAKPCNDLSRGCSVQDIVNTVALTAVQAGA